MKFPFLLLSLAFTGCATVGPDYQRPDLELAQSHRANLENLPGLFGADSADPLALGTWWSAFGDPVLTELVERATVENFDLRQAIARVVEAEARLGVTRASNGPRADGGAAYRRSGISENTQVGQFPGQERESDDYTASISASWELDLWGKAARSIEAAEADLAAGVEGIWAVRVSLAGQVADAYLRLRELQRRMQIAESNVDVLQRGTDSARARFEAGLVQELDLFRARTDLESARAVLPDLERAALAAITELSLLTSVEPGQLDAFLKVDSSAPVALPSPKGRLGTQVPGDLLRRRPDIRTAERELAAQTARVGVATAALYPSLTLTGSIGFQAEKVDNLFKDGSFVHGFGPGLSLPIFSGGGLRDNIAGEDARVDQALLSYESQVLAALHEVDSAATGISLGARRLTALEAAVAQAQESLGRSEILYREGLANIDAVLDSQRALFQLQDGATQASSNLSRAHVELYRALGGGWPID
ncbi:MAG: efflux transporter outer membrane subunit [Planctomycetota bacterium]|nr:efflux transporter outer membrane subunit [Planctomycetota bacterium]